MNTAARWRMSGDCSVLSAECPASYTLCLLSVDSNQLYLYGTKSQHESSQALKVLGPYRLLNVQAAVLNTYLTTNIRTYRDKA